MIEHIQRFLQFHREDSPQEKLGKLERVLREYRLPLQEVVPLFAALLSLPHPDQYPPINLTSQKQRQKTQEALVAWLLEEGERKATWRMGRPALGRSLDGRAAAPVPRSGPDESYPDPADVSTGV